jgi:hypothetical protein
MSGDLWKWAAGMLGSALIAGGGAFWAASSDTYTRAETDERIAAVDSRAVVGAVRDSLLDLIARLEERGVISRRRGD